MATIVVDGRPYEADPARNLLDVCLSHKLDLPYFCWHPAMGSVGACRQCAVKQFKDENDTRGRLVMACMTPAADGARFSIADPEAKAFRASVIEWLMLNHPHDCPVCDEGSECHLQDMTVMTGHNERRFRFPKRSYVNQDLGPFVNHEMNRCIQCYRCVRFYRDYAGGADLDVFGVHDGLYFGRAGDGTLESEYAGNLVEVCPTGVFTDKTLKRHYARKWDLQTAPSICVHCSLGCNVIPGERAGELRRIRNRYNREINGHFLCDRGRYGYEFVNDERRVRRALAPHGPDRSADPLDPNEAIARVAPLLAGRVVGIGSPRASLEANFALQTLVGPDRFFQGISTRDKRLVDTALALLREGPSRAPTLHEVERADAVLVLGEDAPNTAPRLALALRQTAGVVPRQAVAGIPRWHDNAVRELIQDAKTPIYLATPVATRIDDLARRGQHAPPEEIARLGFAVAHALNADAPPVGGLAPEVAALAEEIAGVLRAAERPVVVTGTSCGSEAVLRAAAQVAWACGAGLCCVLPECNSMGLALLGGGSLDDAARALSDGDTLIVLENDLYERTTAADALLARAGHVVVVDHLAHATGARAHTLLPAGTFAESDGTLVNNEGRAQRFFQVFAPSGHSIRESWRWLRDVMNAAGRAEAAGWHALDDVIAALAAARPDLAGVRDAAPSAAWRFAGNKVARLPHRATGRTALHADRSVHEPRAVPDPDAPFNFSMEGAGVELPLPAALVPRFWSPGWNSEQALHRFQEEVEGPLRGGTPGVRLVAPGAGPIPWWRDPPGPFRRREGEWRVVPLHHVFGSDPLSMLSPGVAQRAPAPYVALAPADALGAAVVVTGEGFAATLPVRVLPELTPGTAGLPVGLVGPLPAVVEVKPA